MPTSANTWPPSEGGNEADATLARADLRRFGLILLAGNLLIDLLLAVIGCAVLLPGATDAERRAREAASNLAAAMASEIGAELRQVDNTLATIAELHRNSLMAEACGQATIARLLRTQASLLPQTSSLHLVDAGGDVLLRGGEHPVNVADRDYFGAARDGDRLVFSAPLMERLGGQRSIIAARRLHGPEGSFDGIVAAVLTVSHFDAMFGRLELGARDAVSLRGPATQLVTRHAAQAAPAEEPGSSREPREFLSAYAHNPHSGWYLARSPLDGIERITAYRAVDDYPFMLLAGLATDDFLAPWRQQVARLTTLLCAVAACSAALSLGVHAQRRRQLGAAAQLRQVAREQAAMLNNELVGMARVRGRQALWKNQALEKIFGYQAGELDGHATRALYLDDDSYAMVGAGYRLMQREGRYRTQLKMRRKDGSAVWIDLAGAPVSADESLWMMVDITALKASEEHLKHLALHDPLTQLPNRTLFTEKLDLMLAQGRRAGTQTALCMLDLDGFKPINDSYGHAAGDQVLREVAARLQQCMREGDVVARIGGDEFAMALAGLKHPQELHAILQRLLDTIAAPITLAPDHASRVTASIGVALAPQSAGDQLALQRLADEALYSAKRNGRNRAQLSGAEAAAAVGGSPA